MSKALNQIDKQRIVETNEDHSTESYADYDISEYHWAKETTHSEE